MNSGEMKDFGCGSQGRYLVVMLGTTQLLIICEVEVFEGCKWEEKGDSYAGYVHLTEGKEVCQDWAS